MICGTCREQMNADSRFCSHCGKPIEARGWNGVERLARPREGRMIAGVCRAFADRYGWDVTLVRLLTVVIFFLGVGMILIAYIAAWIIMPNAPMYFVPPPSPENYAGNVGGTPIS